MGHIGSLGTNIEAWRSGNWGVLAFFSHDEQYVVQIEVEVPIKKPSALQEIVKSRQTVLDVQDDVGGRIYTSVHTFVSAENNS